MNIEKRIEQNTNAMIVLTESIKVLVELMEAQKGTDIAIPDPVMLEPVELEPVEDKEVVLENLFEVVREKLLTNKELVLTTLRSRFLTTSKSAIAEKFELPAIKAALAEVEAI